MFRFPNSIREHNLKELLSRFWALSPLLGAILALGLVTGALFFRNSERERELVTGNFLDKADALAWSLEAGTRTGRGLREEGLFLQKLIEETARRNDIAYLAIVDQNGKVLAHSQEEKIGKNISPPRPGEKSAENDAGTFIVTRIFQPLKSYRPRRHHGGSHGRDIPPLETVAELPRYVLLAFDMEPLTEAIKNDYYASLKITLLTMGTGILGILVIFFWNSYRKSSRRLKSVQAEAAEIIANLPLGLITTDEHGQIIHINEMATKILDARNYEKILAIPGIDWLKIFEKLQIDHGINEIDIELAGRLPPQWIGLTAVAMQGDDAAFQRYLFIMRDISQIKSLQDQVARNERLKELGSVAAGVAHEIRNPLSSIRGLAAYLASRTQRSDKEYEAASVIVNEVSRLEQVVSQLLSFTRPLKPELRAERIDKVIKRVIQLGEADINAKKAKLIVENKAHNQEVAINADLITQSLLNLIINSTQAIDEGGKITISVISENGIMRIKVTDDGPGIATEDSTKIFTPYFTTRPTGSGLGLAITRQIVKAHGGDIFYEGVPDQGATFTIYLPQGPLNHGKS